MAKSEEPNYPWWPSVSNLLGAKKAANKGAGAAAFVAGVTALFSVLAIFGLESFPGFSPLSFVAAGLFSIVAWRIYRMSRAWAVLGLSLFIAERAYAFYLRGTATAGGFVGAIVLLGFIHGVRGTFAYHKLLTQPSPHRILT